MKNKRYKEPPVALYTLRDKRTLLQTHANIIRYPCCIVAQNDISCCPDTLQSVQAHGLLMSRPESEHTIQQNTRKSGTMGNKGKKSSGRRTRHRAQYGTQRQTRPWEGATPSNKRKQARAQLETKGDETLGEGHPTKGKKQGRKWGRRRTHHPTKGNKTGWGGGRTIQRKEQKGSQWETKGEKTLGKADTPSSQGKQERIQWETRGGQDPWGRHLDKALKYPKQYTV